MCSGEIDIGSVCWRSLLLRILLLMLWIILYCVLCREGICFQYSRQVRGETGYSSLQLVAASEAFKMIVSVLLLLWDNESESLDRHHSTASAENTIVTPLNGLSTLWRLFGLLQRGHKMVLLVALYLASNLCSLYATATVGAAVSTLFSQLKIVSTALCGKFILGKNYTNRKWVCLWLLVVGCSCVSYPVIAEAIESSNISLSQVDSRITAHQKVLGIICLLIQVSISGFASVYFELVLKGTEQVQSQQKGRALTIWERNFQLAAFSVVCAAVVGIGKMWTNVENVSWEKQGWTALAGATALCQGGAGLFVAATLKHADAVLKCFANSLSIIVVTLVNMWLFDRPLGTLVRGGMVLSIGAMLLYTLDDDFSASRPRPQLAKQKTS